MQLFFHYTSSKLKLSFIFFINLIETKIKPTITAKLKTAIIYKLIIDHLVVSGTPFICSKIQLS
jgi:hypothetical protein